MLRVENSGKSSTCIYFKLYVHNAEKIKPRLNTHVLVYVDIHVRIPALGGLRVDGLGSERSDEDVEKGVMRSRDE